MVAAKIEFNLSQHLQGVEFDRPVSISVTSGKRRVTRLGESAGEQGADSSMVRGKIGLVSLLKRACNHDGTNELQAGSTRGKMAHSRTWSLQGSSCAMHKVIQHCVFWIVM